MPNPLPARIVIVGGGFGGVSAALELSRRRHRRRGLEVHLVSEENYFVFQPLLPEVVSCSIEPSHILNPIRQLCPHVHFQCARVRSIDRVARQVVIENPDGRREQSLGFDHLILAFGQVMDVSRIPGMSEHSLPIRTLGDAFHLRNHLLSRLEEADLEPDEARRRRLLTVVAVGGGFSGVETAAEIHDMLRAVLRYYATARATGSRVILVHSRERILNELDEALACFAQTTLARRGVELCLGRRVQEATGEGVLLDDGRFLPAATVVCTVGSAPHPLARAIGLAHEGGRLITDACLRVENCANIWAVGDCALVPDARRGGHCPPTAQYALREGRHCADNVVSALDGKAARPFRFGGLGQLAIVGRRRGVAQVFGWRLSGIPAWWLWRSVYWMKLPGLRDKVRVGLDWALDLLFPRDIAKLAVERTDQLGRAHFRAGDVIIRQGELGDRFYIIESGEVEVIRQGEDGIAERITVRGAGESFGEIALLRNTVRTATVRCLTPVDVITFTRRDFVALAGSSRVFKSSVERDAAERSGS